MHLILRYSNGRRVDALLLTIGPESLRAAVRERNETLEFLRIGDYLLGEAGERIAIDAIIAAESVSGCRTRSAGQTD
jgi:hypothetical protein